VLFVDDNEDSRFIITTILELAGYEVMTAVTCAEGLRLARAEVFDLYILDNRLPDRTGIRLCRQIREFDRQAPIVFYSGASREVDKQVALSAGAQVFLTKPVSAEELTATVGRLLPEDGLNPLATIAGGEDGEGTPVI
jgi:DNA-binding response OmpR family regulator